MASPAEQDLIEQWIRDRGGVENIRQKTIFLVPSQHSHVTHAQAAERLQNLEIQNPKPLRDTIHGPHPRHGK